MKKVLLLLALLMPAMILCSCDDNDDPKDEYFVRYTAVVEPDREFKISYTDAAGRPETVVGQSGGGRYEVTVGPVAKGFKANLVAQYNDEGYLPVTSLRIEVGKDDDSFVVKATTNEPNRVYDLSWTVGK